MFMVTMRADMDGFERKLGVAPEQARFASALALTRTAETVKARLTMEMRSAFDRPTEYTLGSLFLQSATKSRLQARVWLKGEAAAGKGVPAGKFLSPEVYGGGRSLKRFEVALQRIGQLLPGMYCVPGAAAKLDSHGNVQRSQIVQVLSYLQAFADVGSTKNSTAATRARLGKGTARKRGIGYFVLRHRTGGKAAGIWMRTSFGPLGSSIKPVFLFVRQPAYSIRYRFFALAAATARMRMPIEMQEAARVAMATARG